jgi:hypothetical protein
VHPLQAKTRLGILKPEYPKEEFQMSDNQHHPELHVYEEVRDDLMDTGMGFGVMLGVCSLIFIVAVVIKELS